MTNTKRSLLLSVVSMFLCVVMLASTTFAWFTDSVESTGNIIKTGTLEVTMEWANGKVDPASAAWTDASTGAIFNWDKWEPGYTEVRHIKIENEGSLALKYQLSIIPTGTVSELADVIDVYYVDPAVQVADRAALNGVAKLATLTEAIAGMGNTASGNLAAGENHTVTIALKMQESAGNEYQNKAIGSDFKIRLLATQLTRESDSFDNQYDAGSEFLLPVDTWDGTADLAWYDDTQTEFMLSSAEEFAGLVELVDDGNTFEDKTITLSSSVDLEGKLFDPIGSYRNDTAFKGTFDGQGYTIANLSQNTWELDNGYYYSDCGLGLFGAIEDATIKNLNIDNASISGESALVGIIAAVASGNCTFENINVTNAKAADYQYYAGGIVGWASGEHEYINCNVDASTTIAAQWGDFDNSTGGLIGGSSGSAEILVKDCNIACRIDAYNDVTSSYQWYAYRRCGMIIGNSGKTKVIDGKTYADAPQLTCENVTVTYGPWANYTYCEFAGTSWPYVRVQAGVSNSAYSNPRYGHPKDANGNEVVDDNHVHNDGEDHQILCQFDQLYGGGQGVYGYPTHPGVTVIYNN
ncbi:MAG: hypothetical protein J6V93_02810 [Clostridia bacterium]|nr:hypothetical protein [Clostridia bacterium]